MNRSVLCFLGAGYSYVAGLPLARDLLRPRYLLSLSLKSEKRFNAVRMHYERWQERHLQEFPEQYLGALYNKTAGPYAPPWEWAVEFVSAVIASAGTPPASLNHNPRYSNRISRPSRCSIHLDFWTAVMARCEDISVVTTNYDILIETALRHQPMRRPHSPGCFYGGVPRPQILKGASQPFSRWSPNRFIEMTGAIPLYKLHGSLSWSIGGSTIETYQDMRPAFRYGGNAAIIPPIPEKIVPGWLRRIWEGALEALRRSNIWIVCGYSAPDYDTEVIRLLRDGATSRSLQIFLLSPDSESLQQKWRAIAPDAHILCLPGLPECISTLTDHLCNSDSLV